jgi:hypothetical protein
MILSGLYEASLDRKVIGSMLSGLSQEDKEKNRMSPEAKKKWEADGTQRIKFYKRIHQLYAVEAS